VGSQQQHRHVAEVANPLQHRETVHAGHRDVEHDQIRSAGEELAQPLVAARRLDRAHACTRKERRDHGPQVVVVVHDEHLGRDGWWAHALT